jgi:hypothetical protein
MYAARLSTRASITMLCALLALALNGLVLDRPAQAQSSGSWHTWGDFEGSPGDYHTSMSFPTGPMIDAEVSTDSRGGGVGVISGQSNWLSAGTPIGAKYGSSRNQPYLNLRPQADRADSPSYTAYAFDVPVPPGGWAFALGDIDADQVKVIAKGPDGSTLTASELGFQGAFNYCDAASAGGPSCSGDGTDQPTWNAATRTLVGNAAAADTDGASGWFEPTVPVKSLTFVFTRHAGFPVYQTWFASLGCDVTGTVTDSGAPSAGTKVNLIDSSGFPVESTTTGDDGSYSFPNYLIGGEYTVEVIAPGGKIVDGDKRRQVDLSACPAAPADFQLRDIVPTSVSGNVSTAEGQRLGGVAVTITLADDTTRTTVTDSDGDYLFDDVPAGVHAITIDEPEGYDYAGADQRSITVAPAQTTPITGQDFVLAAQARLLGLAIACEEPLPGVTATLTRPDGSTESTVTDADGLYSFAGLQAGIYTVEVDVPEGHSAESLTRQNVRVVDTDVSGIHFYYSEPTAVTGTVTGPDGAPMSGVALTVTPEGGSQEQATTGDDGTYGIGNLPSGSHTVRITAPDGYEVDGESERTVSNSSTCGDAVADFALLESQDPGDPTTDPGGPSERPNGETDDGEVDPSGVANGDDLPGTGLSARIALVSALFLLAAGAVMIAAAKARRDDTELTL